MSKRIEKRLTFDSVVSSTSQDSLAVNGEHERASLRAFGMRAFNRHARAHEIGFGLPHVKGAVQAGCMEAISTSFIWIIRVSGNAPPPIRLPSGEYAHAFTFVRAPLSFDFTTITVFCFRLFSTSQMLKLRKDSDASRERKA